ncbi:hypothetical protein evm_008139 [Chilo suppressalis]|nr:hypothetical protein evm_008139 [Chilo suppressalis]
MDRVTVLEEEIANLRMILQQKEAELYELKKECIRESHAQLGSTNHTTPELNNLLKTHCSARLPKWAIVRYSRQILLPDIGVKGQEKLCSARVLVVGAGGLGCPAAVYLAGAGVGEIGIVDYDDVEITNIHRQILHSERDECMSKAESAAHKLRSINSHIKVTPYNVQLDSSNAVDIASGYDVVLDCTDNVPTRYLLNDLCVMTGLPLISGSALKMEGQLTIYGYRADRNCNEKNASYRGPCYRCIFPTPPPPQAVGSCSANGVAGPVPGVIGTLQALEAIKMIVGLTHEKMLIERMLLFDGEDMTFKIVNLRGQNQQCAVCSQTPSITRLIDYEAFCKSQAKEKDLDLHILPPANRISATQLSECMKPPADSDRVQRHLLVDVRSEQEFNMCRIEGAVNWPIDSLRDEKFEELLDKIRKCTHQVIFICRRGNDSQIAAKKVLDAIEDKHRGKVVDMTGGLHAWASDVDNDFPVY